MNNKEKRKALIQAANMAFFLNKLATINPAKTKQILKQNFEADKERFKNVFNMIKGAKTQLPALLTIMELVIIEKKHRAQ